MATAKTTGTAAKKAASTTAKRTTSTAKKPAAKKTSSAVKKPAAKKTSSGSRIQVTATEKKLVELYRNADTDTRKAALALLKGEKAQTGNILTSILEDSGLLNNITDIIPGLKK